MDSLAMDGRGALGFPGQGYALLTELLGPEWVVLYRPKGRKGEICAVSNLDAHHTAATVHEADRKLSWPPGIPLGEAAPA